MLSSKGRDTKRKLRKCFEKSVLNGVLSNIVSVAGKSSCGHADFMGAVVPKPFAVDYVKNASKTDGVIEVADVLASAFKEGLNKKSDWFDDSRVPLKAVFDEGKEWSIRIRPYLQTMAGKFAVFCDTDFPNQGYKYLLSYLDTVKPGSVPTDDQQLAIMIAASLAVLLKQTKQLSEARKSKSAEYARKIEDAAETSRQLQRSLSKSSEILGEAKKKLAVDRGKVTDTATSEMLDNLTEDIEEEEKKIEELQSAASIGSRFHDFIAKMREQVRQHRELDSMFTSQDAKELTEFVEEKVYKPLDELKEQAHEMEDKADDLMEQISVFRKPRSASPVNRGSSETASSARGRRAASSPGLGVKK